MFGVSSDAGYKEIIPGICIKSLNYGTNSIMVEFRLTKGAMYFQNIIMFLNKQAT